MLKHSTAFSAGCQSVFRIVNGVTALDKDSLPASPVGGHFSIA
jgi:hypothetical protein